MSLRAALVAAAAVLALTSSANGVNLSAGKEEIAGVVSELGGSSHGVHDPLAGVKARLPANEDELLSIKDHPRGPHVLPNGAGHGRIAGPIAWRPIRPMGPDHVLVTTRPDLSHIIPLRQNPWEPQLVASPTSVYPRLAPSPGRNQMGRGGGTSPGGRISPYAHIRRGPRLYDQQ